MDDQLFDSIVAGFYAAATGAIDWNRALAPVHEAFGTCATVMQTVDMETGRMVHIAHSGPSAQPAILDYVRHWHAHDPRKAYLLAHPDQFIDHWWHCHEHLDDAFVAEDPFYQQFLPAHDSRYLSNFATLVAPTISTSFGLELPASRGPLTPDERHVVKRLGNHVVEALRAYERIRGMVVQALAGHQLLQAIAYPMWLLDRDRFVFFANAQAQQLSDGPVTVSQQRLRVLSRRGEQKLSGFLRALLDGSHGLRASVDARVHPGDPPSWLQLYALQPQRVLGAFGDRPLVLATLFDPRRMADLDAFALSEVFGLTPSEARVATLLAEGITGEAIASRLNCRLSTIRTHLRAVMAKLGAQRLSEAVRILRSGETLWAAPLQQA